MDYVRPGTGECREIRDIGRAGVSLHGRALRWTPVEACGPFWRRRGFFRMIILLAGDTSKGCRL
jgi:hypothetical protein